MYSFLFNKQPHTDFSQDYMHQLGMDSEQVESVLAQREFDLKATKDKVRQECSRRIATHWNDVGQINAALGVYSSEEAEQCKQCIQAHRDACNALLDSQDLLNINYTKDLYWP